MSIRRFLRGLAVVSVTLLALAMASGCGGGSGTTSSDATAASDGTTSSDSTAANTPGETTTETSTGREESAPAGESAPEGNEGNPPGGAPGNSGSSTPTSFVKQVAGVCEKVHRQFEKESTAFIRKTRENPPKPSETLSPEIILIETVVVPRYQEEADNLDALDPPSAMADDFTAFVEALQEAVDNISSEPQILLESEGSFGAAERMAKQFGVPNCTQL